MQEQALLVFRDRFRLGDDSVLTPTWNGIKNATRYYSMKDPSGCLTLSDFQSAALIGIIKAFKKFNPTGGSSLKSWIITICNQSMLRELRQYKRGETVSFSSLNHFGEGDEDNLDFIYSQMQLEFEPSFISEDFFIRVVDLVKEELFRINRRAYGLFKLKLEDQGKDNSYYYNVLSISSGSYSKYMKMITRILSQVIKTL